jgi:hypothetical protein
MIGSDGTQRIVILASKDRSSDSPVYVTSVNLPAVVERTALWQTQVTTQPEVHSSACGLLGSTCITLDDFIDTDTQREVYEVPRGVLSLGMSFELAVRSAPRREVIQATALKPVSVPARW